MKTADDCVKEWMQEWFVRPSGFGEFIAAVQKDAIETAIPDLQAKVDVAITDACNALCAARDAFDSAVKNG